MVEAIGIDIVPISSLKAGYGVDGFLTLDQKEIRVDQNVMMECEVRYRFTLAHELAHYLLHGDAFQDITVETLDFP